VGEGAGGFKMPSSSSDLFELVKKLKYEKLFIASERREIEGLNRKACISQNFLLDTEY
jgi:hypothetical protein